MKASTHVLPSTTILTVCPRLFNLASSRRLFNGLSSATRMLKMGRLSRAAQFGKGYRPIESGDDGLVEISSVGRGAELEDALLGVFGTFGESVSEGGVGRATCDGIRIPEKSPCKGFAKRFCD